MECDLEEAVETLALLDEDHLRGVKRSKTARYTRDARGICEIEARYRHEIEARNSKVRRLGQRAHLGIVLEAHARVPF